MRRRLLAVGPTLLLAGSAALAHDQKQAFGGSEDVRFADTLWQALKEAKLVGEKSFTATPYQGTEPHGAILVTVEGPLEVGGREDIVIVKDNYGGQGVTKETVANDPDKNFGAVTVMFRREAGYDAGSGNWFWAKYLPDGTLDKAPNGASMAGRVAGCIGCHEGAPGKDHVFNHDRWAG